MPAPKRPVVAIDRLTGSITARFCSVCEAADAFMIDTSLARSECRKRYYPQGRFEVLRFADDPEPLEFDRSRNRCVVASDGKTVHAWTCLRRAAECSSLSYHAFVGRMRRGATVDLLGRKMLARYVDRPLSRNAKVVRHV